MKERPILIIAAMEDAELEYLKEKLNNQKKVENNVCTFIEGEMFGKNIVLCASNIGTINAAASLTLAIEKYNPKAIINEGIAGGIGNNVHTGDIVVGIDTINIASYESEKRKLGEGINGYNDLVSFIIGEENHLVPQKADSKLVELARKTEICIENKKIHYGRIGSGDVWNKEVDKIMYLYKEYGVLCEDMETISIYTVANKYNIPCISIKCISDNEVLGEEYDRTTGKPAQEFTCRILSNYFC